MLCVLMGTFRQRIGPVSIRPCSHNVRQRSSLLSQPLPKLSLSSVPAESDSEAAASASAEAAIEAAEQQLKNTFSQK